MSKKNPTLEDVKALALTRWPRAKVKDVEPGGIVEGTKDCRYCDREVLKLKIDFRTYGPNAELERTQAYKAAIAALTIMVDLSKHR